MIFPNTTINHFFNLQWRTSSTGAFANDAEIITQWLSGHRGCLLIDKSGIGYWELWALLKAVPQTFHHRLIIAQHHELRRDFDIRGLHFSPEAPYAPEDYGGKLLGMTVNSFSDALRMGDWVHYLILDLPRDHHPEEKRLFKKGFRGRAVLIDMPISIQEEMFS